MKYINLPFNNISNNKYRAMFILHLAGYTSREISSYMFTSWSMVARVIRACYKLYPDFKVHIF